MCVCVHTYSSHYISIYIVAVTCKPTITQFTLHINIYNFVCNCVSLPQTNVRAIFITDGRRQMLNLTLIPCSVISLPCIRNLPHILVRVYPENFVTDGVSRRCVESRPLLKSQCPILLSSEMRNFGITMSPDE